MKYMILTYGSQQDYDGLAGRSAPGAPAWTAEEFAALGTFMDSFNKELAEQVLGRGLAHGQGSRSARDSATGRTSTKARSRMCSGPGQFARRAAIAVARSKLSQSTSQYPARTSSVSA